MVKVKQTIPELREFFVGKEYTILQKKTNIIDNTFLIYNIGVVAQDGDINQVHIYEKKRLHYSVRTLNVPEIINLTCQGVYNSNDNDWKSYISFPQKMLKKSFEGKYIVDEISGKKGKIATFEPYQINGARFLDDKGEEITAIPDFSIISTLVNEKKFITEKDEETLYRGPGVFIYESEKEMLNHLKIQ